MLCVPYFHKSIINIVFVRQLLVLVHDGCLWLGEPIPIIDILIHRITEFPCKGVDPTKEFGGESGEKELADKMKLEFGLVKKSHRYSIHFIQYQTLQFATQILEGKIMRKCHADEFLAPIVSLSAQCMKGVQYNWAKYLCKEFLVNYREA